MNKKVILMIMDGWGHGAHPASDGIYQAHVPFVKNLYSTYPHCELITCGEAVGLPEGQMGNSEVGHMNIGAGRIVYQELMRINKSIENKVLHNSPALLKAFNYAKKYHKPLHLMGLVSDGGVHSHINHLMALCDIAKEQGLKEVYVHAFTDGRDTDPQSGLGFLEGLQKHLEQSVGEIASVTGRYYAMDRDNRWQRVKIAYDALVAGVGERSANIYDSVRKSYAENVTDEFIKPIVKVNEKGYPIATIAEGDVVLCFNFRTDRCREITRALTQQDFPEFEMKKLALNYTTMTIYDHTFQGVHYIFSNDDLTHTLGETLTKNGLTQIRMAETEKYPHVTFFFNGGREQPFPGEYRFMVPSPKVATYDLQPEMSAIEIKNLLISKLKELQPHFVCINFANADMVGHTGVMAAVKKAVETVDRCVNEVVEAALELDYAILLTADHGNADYMINEDGSPNTAHTLNPVPLFLIDRSLKVTLKNGKLGDLAPTILTLMELTVPKEMSGEILIGNQ
ncbi:MAG: 2,3-bisphosphoglycerate-independent phosphoglycerate mutase [Chitinophagales bacterium]